MQGILYSLALAAGFVLTIQVGLNAAVSTALGNPGSAALVNFLIGSVALVVFLLAIRVQWPSPAAFGAVPLWAWGAGVLGAFYVVSATFVGPKLGAATFLALVVFGQLLSSLLVDHFGLLGFPQHSITLLRLAGAVLLFIGVLLIAR